MKTLTSAHIHAIDKCRDDFRQHVARAREKRSLGIKQGNLADQLIGMLSTLGTLLRQIQLQRSLNRAAAQERALPTEQKPAFPDTDEGRRAHAKYVAAQIEADNRTEYSKAVEHWRRLPNLYE